ncbi:MAG: phosphoglycerate kinase [Patescibacteria group bacterium]
MHSIETVTNLSGVRVLVRCSYDVPVKDEVVVDTIRLDNGLQTVEYLIRKGARIILIGHIGRDPKNSLKPVYEYLKQKINLTFVDDITGDVAHRAVEALEDGGVLLLENLRRDPGEKGNDENFAHSLASLADIYVDDAFTNAHRHHASMVGVTKLLPSYAGFQFLAEVEGLKSALAPSSPSLAIVGGAKFETKVVLVHTLLEKYDFVFVGGAVVNDFFVAKGYSVGKSLVSKTPVDKDILQSPKILLPEIVTVEGSGGRRDVLVRDVLEDDVILDIAPASILALQPTINSARSILWNGPMGNFEKGFTAGTDALAIAIAGSSAKSIVGGGDTLSSIQNLGLMDKFTFVSTAGGAMLDFLANGTLPGIEALD